jgi:hypothetical protein
VGKGVYGGKTLRCKKCDEDKSTDEFHVRLKSTTGYRRSCKACLRKQKVMRVYGLSSQEYDTLYSKVECYICGSKEYIGVYGKVKELSVDHCHTTGKVRGLLCQSCNVGLGAFKDNPASLRKAASYLEGL